MSFICIVGMFGLSARDKSDNFVFYDTSIECSGSPHPIPAELRRYPLAEEPRIVDGAVANITAKLYVPCMNPPQPILLDALETEVFPGDPSDEDYLARIPVTKSPTIFANGVVSDSNQSSTDSIVTFLLTASEFVRNSLKQTTLLYPFTFCAVLSITLTHVNSCRLDKASKRWKNVPAPARSAQISVMGKCFDLMPNGLLSIDLLNIGLSPPPPTYLPPSTTFTNNPNKRRRLLAKVPPRTFPPTSESTNVPQQHDDAFEKSNFIYCFPF